MCRRAPFVSVAAGARQISGGGWPEGYLLVQRAASLRRPRTPCAGTSATHTPARAWQRHRSSTCRRHTTLSSRPHPGRSSTFVTAWASRRHRCPCHSRRPLPPPRHQDCRPRRLCSRSWHSCSPSTTRTCAKRDKCCARASPRDRQRLAMVRARILSVQAGVALDHLRRTTGSRGHWRPLSAATLLPCKNLLIDSRSDCELE